MFINNLSQRNILLKYYFLTHPPIQSIHPTNLNFFIIYQQPNLTYNIISFIFNLITKKIFIAVHVTTFDRLSQKNESHRVTKLVIRLLHSLSTFVQT